MSSFLELVKHIQQKGSDLRAHCKKILSHSLFKFPLCCVIWVKGNRLCQVMKRTEKTFLCQLEKHLPNIFCLPFKWVDIVGEKSFVQVRPLFIFVVRSNDPSVTSFLWKCLLVCSFFPLLAGLMGFWLMTGSFKTLSWHKYQEKIWNCGLVPSYRMTVRSHKI